MPKPERNAINGFVIALAVEAIVGLFIFGLWALYVAHVEF